MRLIPFVAVAVFCGAIEPCGARVWLVGGSSPDFTEIQPAIDAATDGDVVLVRPGTYEVFTLSKGVTVAASSTPFNVTPTFTDGVVVSDVAQGLRAGISGMSMSFSPAFTILTMLEVRDCDGEITLADLELTTSDFPVGTTDCLVILDSQNVSLSDVRIHRGDDMSLRGAVHAERSRVRVEDAKIESGKQQSLVGLDGAEGAAAIHAIDSLVIIASANLVGGEGADGGAIFRAGGVGGEGGDALKAVNSEVLVIGAEDAGALKFSCQGGNGGDAAYLIGAGYAGPGGDGGEGFSGEVGLESLMEFKGGTGGTGTSDGDPGLPYEGTLISNPILPLMSLSGDFIPGGTFSIDLEVVLSGGAFLIFADHQGFLKVSGNSGPPLSVIPGGRFIPLFLGHVAVGDTHLDLSLPNDPSARGLALHCQAVFLLDVGGIVLSNADSRVIGE